MPTVEKIISDDIRDRIIHGAAILAGNGARLFYNRGFGFAENERKFPMTADAVIDCASITKVVATITALLICRDRGLVDFDAPFTDYLKEFKPKPAASSRVRDLANHTSGFGDVPGQKQRLYFDESGSRMLENMLTTPPPFPPGGPIRYACWNYILLRIIVEKITGKKFPDFCRDEIFRPLGMADTSMGAPNPDLPPERLAQTSGTRCAGAGRSLLHSGGSGQTIFMNFQKNVFVIVLTPRCGDYDRAKKDRFEIIRQLFAQIP